MNRIADAFVRLCEKVPYWLLALLGRLSIGLVFWNSGRSKVEGWNLFQVNEKTLFLFQEEYKVPLLNPEFAAFLAQLAEHVFPFLLFIGLATRLSALALLGMTLVIGIFVYPEAYVTHGLWAAVLLMLVKYGPGAASLDHTIARR